MSLQLQQAADADEEPARTVFVKGRRRKPLRALLPTENVVLFAVSYAVYATVGVLVVLHWNVIVGDAVSRLAHAYFVWFNDPPKLTAVGFVWPPLMTIVLLPLALVKPVATSLLALPLTSAFFGAALVVVLDRTLALIGLPRLQRLPLVALLGLNPMLVYYAGNGMGETVYLFLLALAVYSFLRWYLEPNLLSLVLASAALTLGLLTRYELLFWALALGVAIVGVLVRRRAPRAQLESTSIAFFAPIAYGLGLWVFFNWLILGDPLHWLSSEVTLTFVETRVGAPELSYALGDVIARTASVTWHLFPATAVVIAALVAVAAWRRDLVSFVLAVLIALNPVTTAGLAVLTKVEVVFQLRYNLRAVPLALVGLAWLWRLAPPRWRLGVWVVAMALVGLSIPETWRTMQTYERQALEQAFTRAVSTASDQEGTRSLGSGIPVGDGPERAAARWLLEHAATGTRSILADDEEAFAVMLYTGKPDRFFDRIDEGEVPWRSALEQPRGRVRYVLTATFKIDLVRRRYPALLERGVPGLTLAYDNERWAIFRVEG
jgi:hypothetical protein